MAQRVTTTLLDDIDAANGVETVAEATHRFSFGGQDYEIDLSKENGEGFLETLGHYARHARKAGASKAPGRSRGGRSAAERQEAAAARAWANENGIEVSERGRIPASVVAAYKAKDPSLAKGADDGVASTS